MDTKRFEHDIIVIGGSTGAVDPLRALIARLPEQFNAAIFIALHMPSHSSGMVRTITAASHLPVSQVQEGMPIEHGRIYLAAPDYHLLLTDRNKVRLGKGPRENMVRPAIDALFRSAAVAYGPRVIGVLLSGRLNDGVSGLEAIKRCGGITVVQDPNDAVAEDMPRHALRTVTIDRVAAADQLGELICGLVREPAAAPVDVPADIQLEVHIAAGERSDSQTMRDIAEPAPLTCPSCGGVLSQLREGKPLRYRCQVGHALTAEVLEREQEGSVDEALRVALRVIEERAELVSRMANDGRMHERSAVADIYERRATEYRTYADVIRRAIMMSMTAAPAGKQSGQEEVD